MQNRLQTLDEYVQSQSLNEMAWIKITDLGQNLKLFPDEVGQYHKSGHSESYRIKLKTTDNYEFPVIVPFDKSKDPQIPEKIQDNLLSKRKFKQGQINDLLKWVEKHRDKFLQIAKEEITINDLEQYLEVQKKNSPVIQPDKKEVHVDGFTKEDGTKVESHTRSMPD